MKTFGLKRTVLLLIMIIGGMRVNAQQQNAEVPGDNFSLEGALELFKKSASPEDFEKLLNSPDSKVNNLDLNGDGYIDYIRVIDRNEGNVHAFILQAIVSDTEGQDVAVIELEKLANGKAVLQITGDADVYGIETIIEPTEEVRVYAGTTSSRTVVNVWAWPSVQYIYSPYYTSVWISPWRWSYRPYWYRPWRPVAYHVYSPWWRPYHSYYSVCYTHRVTYAHHLYSPYRTTSVLVHNRHHDRIYAYRSSRHDYDHNGRYKYADNGKRPSRGDNWYGDRRSNGRQQDSRGTNTTGRQTDLRRTYADNTARSSMDRKSLEPVGSDYTKRDYSSATTSRRSESTSPNRSYGIDQNRSANTQRSTTNQRSVDTSSKWTNSGNTSGARQQTTRSTPTSNGSRQQATHSSHSSGSRQSVTRPSSSSGARQPASRSSSIQRSAPAGNSSGQRSGSNSRSPKISGNTKKRGN